jgi:PST family polysaccharide transporter
MDKERKRVLINNTIMMYVLSFAKLIIPLFSLPYLTRVLSVDCYGGISFIKSIMAFVQIIIDFGFMLSATKDLINLIKKDGDVNRQIGNILYAQLILSGIALVVIITLSFTLDILDGLEVFAILSCVSVILTVFLFEYVFKAYEQMGKISIRFIVMKLIAFIFTIIFIKNDSHVILIPIFDIIASIVAIVMVVFQMKGLGVKCDFKFGRIKEALSILKTSFVYFLSDFSTTIFNSLYAILIGLFLTKSDVAYWTLAMQMLNAVHVLYNPIINSVYPEMIKNKNLTIIHKIVLFYIPLIIIGCVLVYFLSDWLISWLFTENYLKSATLFKMLIPVLIISFPSMLYGWPCLVSIGKEKVQTITIVLGIVVQLVGISILLFINCFELQNLIIIRCAAELIVCLSRLIVVYKNKRLFMVSKK